MNKRKMSRNWLFRVSNPEDAIYPELDWPDVRYCVYQEEIGAGGENTHHFQGYVQFYQPKRMTGLKKLPGLEGAWLGVQRGTNKEAQEYCTKEDETTIKGTVYETGDFTLGHGARTDLIKIREKIKEGKGWKDLFEDDNTLVGAVHYTRGVQQMMSAYNAELIRDFKTNVEVYVGHSGLGKTRKAAEENPGLYMKPHSKWWDQYNFEEVVLFDDFYGWYPYHQLLILLDRYKCPVEIKNGYINIAPKKVIITSNKHIMDWYDKEKIHDISPLLRRVDKYVWFRDTNDTRVYVGSDMDQGLPTWYRKFQSDWL